MDSGVARRPIIDMAEYENQLRGRLDPTAAHLQLISDYVRAHPKRIAFAEGEEETVIRAAVAYRNSGYGTPILIGREDRIAESAKSLGIESLEGVEISNAALSHKNKEYAEFLYGRLQRKGFLWRDCQRMVNQKRNVFAAVMVAKGDADGLITGLTRNFHRSFTDISSVIDAKPGEIPMGLSIAIAKGRTVFIADTRVHSLPRLRSRRPRKPGSLVTSHAWQWCRIQHLATPGALIRTVSAKRSASLNAAMSTLSSMEILRWMWRLIPNC